MSELSLTLPIGMVDIDALLENEANRGQVAVDAGVMQRSVAARIVRLDVGAGREQLLHNVEEHHVLGGGVELLGEVLLLGLGHGGLLAVARRVRVAALVGTREHGAKLGRIAPCRDMQRPHTVLELDHPPTHDMRQFRV